MGYTVWAARLVVLAAFLDLFCQFPVVAPYARSLGAGPLGVALVIASYDAANLVGNLGAGFVLDGWGRKRALVCGLLVAAGCLLLYGMVTSPLQLGLVRGVHGLAQAILSPGAFAVLSDAVPPARRAQAMGTAGVFIAAAAVAGPLLAGVLADRRGPEAVFLTVALVLAAVALVVSRAPGTPEPLGPPPGSSELGAPAEVELRGPRPGRGSAASDPGRGAAAPASDFEWGTAKRATREGVGMGAEARPVRRVGLGPLLRRRPLLAAYGAALAWTAGIGTLVVHLPLVLDARGVPASVRGGAFAVYALVALVLMAGPAPYLANRLGRPPPLAGGLVLIGTALLWLSFGGSTGAVYGAMALFGLGFGLLFPAATALVADATVPAERASAFGVFYAAYSLGVVGGEVGSGLLASRFGIASGAPFLAAAILAFAVAPLVLLAVRGQQVTTEPLPAAPSPSGAQ